MFYPKQKAGTQVKRRIRSFLGLEQGPDCSLGAFEEMENLTSDRYPAMGVRPGRTRIRQLTRPLGLLGKKELVWIDGDRLYVDGTAVEGIRLNANLVPKQLVSMGAYVLVFPDGVYCSTEDLTDAGTLACEQTYSCQGSRGVRFAPCLEDGTEFDRCWIQPGEPNMPADGEVWVDTGVLPHVYRKYHEETGCWEQLPEIFAKVEAFGTLGDLRVGEMVTLSGCICPDGQGGNLAEAMNGCYEIVERPNAYTMRLRGVVLRETVMQRAGAVTVSRWVPEMDYVTQCGNRLWGCRYGASPEGAVNEIYASALGDFRVWNRYRGLSTDSYAASRGTDGPWTGAVTYQNCPIFFKENCLERVYPSAAGAHQIVTVSAPGVAPGCGGSLCVVGGVLYYMGTGAVYAYDGSLPRSVSRCLGNLEASGAQAGTLGDKYYLCLRQGETARLLVYDTVRNLWHQEDSTAFLGFAQEGGRLCALAEDGGLMALTGASPEERVCWYAQTGALGLDGEGDQLPAGVGIRCDLPQDSDLEVWVRYDEDPRWHHKCHAAGGGLRHLRVPILPRRCDHFRLRLEGRGPCTVYSLTLVGEEGSEDV